jgi:Leucine-rich repeat (LRR) protein
MNSLNLTSISKLYNLVGQLPHEIGQITELIEINIRSSDLSAGPIPDSIGLCTKLVKVGFFKCKLEGEFPKGLQTLKSLRISIYNG